MAIPPNRIVVVGCGDPFASDAAAGLEVAAMLRRTPGHSCEVRELDLCTPSFISELAPEAILAFAQGVISNSPPGSVHVVRLGKDGLPEPSATANLRVWDEISNLLKLASRLSKVYLIGIEMERTDAGIGISSSVHAGVVEVVKELAGINEKGQPKLPFLQKPKSS